MLKNISKSIKKVSIHFGDILSNDEDVRYSNGVSIKLSALNSRYERHKYKDLETELIPKLIELGLLAKKKIFNCV